MKRLRMHRDERGMTLPEVMVTMIVMSIVAVIFMSTLAAVQRTLSRTESHSINNDQARLAVIELDREIRSGNLLYDPASENPAVTGVPAGFALRIYTQSNANIRTPSPGYVCRLWRIDDEGRLETRSWPPGQPEGAGGWITVAEGIVNRDVSPAVPAFSRTDPSSASGGRTLNITLLVNNDYADRPSETVRIQTAITGRNTSYGFPVNVCSDTPS